MSYIIRIDSDAHVGLIDFNHHVTGTDMLEACRDLVGRPDWQRGYDELWDLSGADVDVQPGEITELLASAHALRGRIGPNRVAFVTTREAVDVLVRLFELFTTDLGRTYRTVPTRAAAAAWLGVSAEAAGPA